MGLNITKTKMMVVNNTPINANNVLIENVEGYVYLGQDEEKNQDTYIQRRIMADWAAYAKHRNIYKRNIAICLKRQVYNSCVLPAMENGVENCALTKQAHTKMKRSMLNITYKDRMTKVWVRERAQVIDIISNVRPMKCPGQGISTASKTTDGPRVPPLGDHMTRKDDKGDQPSGRETTSTNTGAKRSGKGQHNIW